MYRISKEFSFSASHQLSKLPQEHPCSRLHGHNYRVIIELSGDVLNEYGFIRDYRTCRIFKDYLDTTLDHRHLNDVFEYDCVTAEYLAHHFYNWCKKHFPETTAIRVSETANTWAEYRP